ncbi:MAG TPA: chitobiase/beta-hexosaminidase C-terminal domain-containing protein [Sedimentisphaerales bacterium]|nr:chitobiase/beta-hexosaminidase C-terminal domain-containing protein [Sedimentisphaerales bacterium]
MWRSTQVAVFLFVSVLGIGRMEQGAAGSVLINEFMAANSSTLADPQGRFDDWVELYNTGDSPIDVAGMYLTDDPKSPTKWQIPTGMPNSTRIAAKGLLVIWLDGDTADPGLHASLRLDAGGDQIALFDKDGSTLLDHVVFERQRSDVSCGRSPSGADDWRYMMLATPGSLNSVPYEGLVADTKFSRDRGFYDAPFEVTITCKTPDAIIYYTLDGSEPGSATGRLPKGTIYSGPIVITRTTCLRARAIKEGWLPSDVDTHTYLFLADAVTTQAAVVARGYPDKWFGSYPADYEWTRRSTTIRRTAI